MHVVVPPSRLRQGARRLVMAICALILGAGFSPVLPSTVESPAAVPFAQVPATAAEVRQPAAPPAPDQQSTVDIPAPPPGDRPAAAEFAGNPVRLDGRHVCAADGRAPPFNVA